MRDALRIAALLLAVVALESTSPPAQPSVPTQTPASVENSASVQIEPPEPEFAVPTTKDRVGRIVVPVMVNHQGPYKFVFDTGANTTVLSPHLAETLGLTVDEDQKVNMNGVTGMLPVPTTQVARVESGSVVLESQRLAVAQASLIGTDGVLGVDGLKDKVVVVDFRHDTAKVMDGKDHRPAPHVLRLHARARFGRLLVIDAYVHNIKVAAVIDTGGQRTLGNYALYKAMGLKPSMTIRGIDASIVGLTDKRQPGEYYSVRQVTLGRDLAISNLGIVFGDFYIYKLWNLEDTPAIVIGMDMLGTLEAITVDYLRLEVQIRAGREWGNPLHAFLSVAGL